MVGVCVKGGGWQLVELNWLALSLVSRYFSSLLVN